MKTLLNYVFIITIAMACSTKPRPRSISDYELEREFENQNSGEYVSLEDFLDEGIEKDSAEFEIKKVIYNNIPLFKKCYMTSGANSRGAVTLVFRIRPDGKVQRAGIMESKLPMKLKACLVEKIYNINFPKLDSNVPIDVKQPLSF